VPEVQYCDDQGINERRLLPCREESEPDP
jgi:hypothetical protein